MTTSDIYTTPAEPAPPGQTAGLTKLPSKEQPGLVAAAAVCITLATVFVAIRVFTKAHVLRSLKVEDYALIFAWAGLVAFIALIVTSGAHGQGLNFWNISIANAVVIANLTNISEILYGPVMFAAKFSVLKQTERIFCTSTQRKSVYYWWIQAMIWANAAFSLSFSIVFLCACIPRSKLWETTLPGNCMTSTNTAIIATSIVNIVSDWSALILPLIVIHRLQMNARRKLGVMAIFAVGLLACVASIVRLVYSVQLVKTVTVLNTLSIWAFIEFTTVILSSCFPILPKFIHVVRHGRAESSSNLANHHYVANNSSPLKKNHSLPLTTMSSRGDQDVHGGYVELDEHLSAV